MTAKIIKFPELKKEIGYIIPLFTDEQILLTITAVNIFSTLKNKISEKDLVNLDPVIVIDALQQARTSEILSSSSKQVINIIIKSIETVELRDKCQN